MLDGAASAAAASATGAAGGHGTATVDERLSAARDTAAVGRVAASAGFGIARFFVNLGFRAGLERGVVGAHAITGASLGAGAAATDVALGGADKLFEMSKVPSGGSLRLALGAESGDAVMFIKELAGEIGGPPDGMSLSEMAAAAGNLAFLQEAAGLVAPVSSAAAGDDHPDLRDRWPELQRYLKFAIGAYGHLALRFLGILPKLGGPTTNEDAVVALTGVKSEQQLVSDWKGPHPGNNGGVPHPDAVVVDPTDFFDGIVATGSEMFTSHMPESYLQAVVGHAGPGWAQ
eukprot:g2137.t1